MACTVRYNSTSKDKFPFQSNCTTMRVVLFTFPLVIIIILCSSLVNSSDDHVPGGLPGINSFDDIDIGFLDFDTKLSLYPPNCSLPLPGICGFLIGFNVEGEPPNNDDDNVDVEEEDEDESFYVVAKNCSKVDFEKILPDNDVRLDPIRKCLEFEQQERYNVRFRIARNPFKHIDASCQAPDIWESQFDPLGFKRIIQICNGGVLLRNRMPVSTSLAVNIYNSALLISNYHVKDLIKWLQLRDIEYKNTTEAQRLFIAFRMAALLINYTTKAPDNYMALKNRLLNALRKLK